MFLTNLQNEYNGGREGPTCVHCSTYGVDTHDKVVECERCRDWHCSGCLKVTDAKYQLLSEFITRLGKKTDGRDRSMKVIMTCEADKIRVIDRIKDLRRSTKEGDKATLREFHIIPDLTAAQRLERKTLIQELDRRRSVGEDDIVIRNRRIVKHSFRGRGQPANFAYL